jgi:hypothetical protein
MSARLSFHDFSTCAKAAVRSVQFCHTVRAALLLKLSVFVTSALPFSGEYLSRFIIEEHNHLRLTSRFTVTWHILCSGGTDIGS